MCVCDYDYYDDEFISALLLYGPSAGRDYGDLRKIINKFHNDECVAPYILAPMVMMMMMMTKHINADRQKRPTPFF